MEHPNAALIARFYDAFARRDAAAMAACYHPDVHFRDPVFELRGPMAGAMWRMLCSRGEDLRVQASGIQADDETATARWTADYSFGPSKRPVHNEVEASFTFRDGLIASHTDRFDFWRWSRQALGLPGVLLGWSPWIRRSVSARANRQLARYAERHPEARS